MAPSIKARIIVVEDSTFTRATLCGALRDVGVNVVGEAASAADGLDLAQRLAPHAAVIDLDLGAGPNGADLAVSLREMLPTIGVVILTSYEDPRLTGRSVAHLPGGSVYLTKGELSSAEALARAIGTAMRNAADPVAAAAPPIWQSRGQAAGLTDTQVEVARMVAEGLSNAEIARQRGVTPPTIERIIQRIASEIGIETEPTNNRRVLIARAYLRMSGSGAHDH